MSDDLKDLTHLTDALYRAELSKFQTIVAREASLRSDLNDLDEHQRQSQSLPEYQMQGVRQIGADVLWQGWVARTRQNLNTELAQVLAQKERLMVELRRAFGKREAAVRLLEQDAVARKKHQNKKFWQSQDELQAGKTAES